VKRRSVFEESSALLEPGALSPLAKWADLINAGGRFVLAIAVAALAELAASAVAVKKL